MSATISILYHILYYRVKDTRSVEGLLEKGQLSSSNIKLRDKFNICYIVKSENDLFRCIRVQTLEDRVIKRVV